MDNSPEFRLACEARYCLTLSREERQSYYAMVESRRGFEATQRLIEAVRAEYRKAPDLFSKAKSERSF